MKPAAYRLSKQCAPDLDGIADYLIAQNERAAKRVVAALFDAFEVLGENPEAGERRDELRAGLRVFSPRPPAHNYVICYSQTRQGVEISRVFHGARDWMQLIRRGNR